MLSTVVNSKGRMLQLDEKFRQLKSAFNLTGPRTLFYSNSTPQVFVRAVCALLFNINIALNVNGTKHLEIA